MTGVVYHTTAPPSPADSTSSSSSSSASSATSSMPSQSTVSETESTDSIPAELLQDGGFADEGDDDDEEGVSYQEDFLPEKGVNMRLQCGYAECAGRTFNNVAMLTKHWQAHKGAAAEPTKRGGKSRSTPEKRRRPNYAEEDEEDDRGDKSFRSKSNKPNGRSGSRRSKRSQLGEDEDEEEETGVAQDGGQLSMLELLALRGDMLGLSGKWKIALKQAKSNSAAATPARDAVMLREQAEEHAANDAQQADGGEEESIVEEIVKHRRQRKELQFLVKWEGHAEQTWEPFENVQHLLDEMYPNYHKAAPRRRR